MTTDIEALALTKQAETAIAYDPVKAGGPMHHSRVVTLAQGVLDLSAQNRTKDEEIIRLKRECNDYVDWENYKSDGLDKPTPYPDVEETK